MRLRDTAKRVGVFQVKVWPQSCFDCAIKRGWTPEIIMQERQEECGYGVSPMFMCAHRTDMNGDYLVCAAMQKLMKEWVNGQ